MVMDCCRRSSVALETLAGTEPLGVAGSQPPLSAGSRTRRHLTPPPSTDAATVARPEFPLGVAPSNPASLANAEGTSMKAALTAPQNRGEARHRFPAGPAADVDDELASTECRNLERKPV